ncbi:hypothetical protein GCM10010297_53190 [Streptomyces malachitofuscus]|nr:hypothetical protein GCM10010297_53190 [Streptomyces malachitofuscus]
MPVEQFLNKTDDALYELLGSSLLGHGLGVSSEDPDHARRFGREWFDRQLPELRRRVCGHERLRGAHGASASDRAVDALALYEILGDFGGSPTHAALVAVLVVRIGVGTLCAGHGPQS